MDASKIDGAADFRIWWDIMIPLSKGIMATVGIFVFVYTWSDFMGPLLYINSVEKRTLSLGMTMFLSEHEVKWGALMAASAIFNFYHYYSPICAVRSSLSIPVKIVMVFKIKILEDFMEKQYICVDIGGTFIKHGLVSRTGDFLHRAL